MSRAPRFRDLVTDCTGMLVMITGWFLLSWVPLAVIREMFFPIRRAPFSDYLLIFFVFSMPSIAIGVTLTRLDFGLFARATTVVVWSGIAFTSCLVLIAAGAILPWNTWVGTRGALYCRAGLVLIACMTAIGLRNKTSGH